MSKPIVSAGYVPDTGTCGRRSEEASSFCDNLQLVLDHGNEILRTERYFYCYPDDAFLSLAYFGGGPIPLGALILLWRAGEMLDVCQACGGTVHIIGAGGSPLSGSHSWWGCCVRCGRKRRGQRESFSTLWPPVLKMLRQYRNEAVIQRGKRRQFSWSKGLVGEDTPGVVIKPRIEGVSVATLIAELKNTAHGAEERA